MAKILKENKLLPALFLAGLAAALVLCALRFGMERDNGRATAIIAMRDVEILAGDYGIPARDYSALLQAAGLYTLTDEELRSSPTPLYLYMPGLSGPYDPVRHGPSAVGLIEDKYQITFNPIEGFAPDGSANMVKVFYLLPSFARRYATLGYEGAQEVENILYRALTDRDIRVLWITPFIHSETGEIISEPEEYKAVMENLAHRAAPHGISLGADFSLFPKDYKPAAPLVILCFWGIAAAGVLLIFSVFRLGKRLCAVLTSAAAAGSAAAYLAVPELSVYGAALFASVIFPCLGLWYLAGRLGGMPEGGLSLKSAAARYAVPLLCAVAFSAAGGLFIAALQSSTRYLLSIINFRGVKVSQITPILFAVFILLRGLYGGAGIKGVVKKMLEGGRLILVLFCAVLAAAAAYYLLRTGDGMVSISIAEQRFRNFLEYYLIARPRTAEFMIAWPCLALAVMLIGRGYKRVAWPFAILVSPGLASVANTFCHSRSPLWLSLARTAFGAGIGLALGLLAIALLGAVLPESKRGPGI